jgi:hypothetical protein
VQDRFGLVPPEIRAQLDREEFVGRQAHQGKALSQALRSFDRNLSVVWIKSDIPPDELPGNAIPGRWHVEQNLSHRGLPPQYYPIVHKDGSYREPDFGVLREFQERDTSRLSLDELMAKANRPSQKQREKPLKDEQAHDETLANFKTAKRVAGEGGLRKRKWGAGGRKGLIGH